MSEPLLELLTDMPKAANKVFNGLVHAFGNPGGGLVFPLLYGGLVWRCWDNLGAWRYFVWFPAVFFLFMAVFFPWTLNRYLDTRRRHVTAVHNAFQEVNSLFAGSNLPDELRRQFQDRLGTLDVE